MSRKQAKRASAFAGAGMAIILALGAADAAAYDFELPWDITGTLQAQVAAGAILRTEDRDPSLVGKLNLPGQEQFCEDKPLLPPGSAPGINCTTVEGNAAFLALPGLASLNTDNGNLNYEQGELTSAVVKFTPRLQLTAGDFGLDVSAVAFWDAVNTGFDEYHPNNFEDNNGFQPRRTARPGSVEDEVGHDIQLLDAYVSGSLPLPGERLLNFKIGNQILSMGTTAFLVLNGLNTVNPPDANLRNLPGSDIREVFKRVPLALLSTAISDTLSVQAFYQFRFESVSVPPIGSFFSVNDVLGSGDAYASLLFGKNREDPFNLMGTLERTQGNANLLSDAGRTIYLNPEKRARDDGQYGVSVGYLAEWLNGTSFEFVYMNLHNRLPIVSFIASDKGCVSDAVNEADALVRCRGFNTTPLGTEVLPIDTVRIQPEYVEDVAAYGLSFSTNLGAVAWTGEAVYRPEQPLQVDPTDVGFAALQTVFPARTLSFAVVDIPGRRVATPDYIETLYRGNTNLQPGQHIDGYERFETLNLNTTFLILLGASENPVGADQITTLVELGAYQVFDLPPLDQLQIAAPGVLFHHSAGVDGTGTPTPTQLETGAQNRLNPHFQDSGFADEFSWGYRIVQSYAYDNLIYNWRIAPQLGFFHDVDGRSPLPSGEFVQHRKQAILGVGINFSDVLSATLRYSWFWGGGVANPMSDRDNFQFGLAYDF